MTDAASWFFVCKLDELNSGAREVLIQGRVIALFKTPSGYWAVDGMCAHQGGPIAKGSLDGCCVTCPWHGWQYDVTNGRNLLSGRKMLTTYPVEVRHDGLWLSLPAG